MVVKAAQLDLGLFLSSSFSSLGYGLLSAHASRSHPAELALSLLLVQPCYLFPQETKEKQVRDKRRQTLVTIEKVSVQLTPVHAHLTLPSCSSL